MSASCEFICDNTLCNHYGKYINVVAPWPLGDIDSVIQSLLKAINLISVNNLKNKQTLINNCAEVKNYLLIKKLAGEKYACIQSFNYLPITDIPIVSVVGYRLQKWCNICPRVEIRDVLTNEEIFVEESLIQDANFPKTCSECNNLLLNFTEVLDWGLLCPHCRKQMKQNRKV